MYGRLFVGLLLLGAGLLLPSCAVPQWLIETGAESPSLTQEALPVVTKAGATGTPIDAVGSALPLPADASQESGSATSQAGTAVPAALTPSAEEELCSDIVTGDSLSYEEALVIAADSECTTEGDLLPAYFCNPNTGTWWIGLDIEREGCNPACVVNVNDLTAEINWRCTGLQPPAEETVQPQEPLEIKPTAGGAATFKEWEGIIHRQPSGSLVEYRFLRDDDQWFDIGARESAMRQKFAAAAWSGAKVILSGKETAVSGALDVQRLVELPAKSGQARNLTAFAMPETSSRLAADDGGSYYAWSAVDGSLSQPWCEGVSGPGTGEWLQLDFTAPVEISEIRLANGYQSGDFLFVLNNRVQSVAIFTDGERLNDWTLFDTREWQSYSLAGDVTPGVVASSIRLVIEDTIDGWEFDDTCIAEVEVWGIPE